MKRFAARASLLFLLLSTVIHWPILAGRVPLPAEIALNLPLWWTSGGEIAEVAPHGEMGDLITQAYPWKAFAARSFSRHEIPLWSPHVLLGAPFLANSQSAVLGPFALLYGLVPLPLAWAIAFLIRPVLAGVFMALYARNLGSTDVAALAGGAIFAFCGFLSSWQGWSVADSALWLPLMLLAIDRLDRAPSARSVALAGLACALPVLAGHPQTAFNSIGLAVAYGLFRAATVEHSRRFVSLLVAAGLLSGGLAAVQILPTSEWIAGLWRDFSARWGPRTAVEIAAFVSRNGTWLPEAAAYVSVVGLFVAAYAALGRARRKEALFFGAALIIALQIIYGHGPAYWLSQHLPVLRGLPPGRLLLVADFAIAVLAALGLTAIASRPDPPGRGWRIAWISSALVVGAGVLLLRSLTMARPDQWLVPLALLIIPAVMLLARGRALSGQGAAAALSVVIVLDMTAYAYGRIPFVAPASRESVLPEPRVYRYLQDLDRQPFRVASVDHAGPSNAELVFGLDTPTGYDTLSTDILRTVPGLNADPIGASVTFSARKIVDAGDRRIDLMNLKYLIATTANASAATLADAPDRFQMVYEDSLIRVYRNLRALPRAFLAPAGRAEVVADVKAAAARLREAAFDPEQSVIVDRPLALGAGRASAASPGTVRVLSISSNRASMTASADAAAVLVYSDAFDAGWQVTVDGVAQPVLRVDAMFKGVELTPGEHRVEFRYLPRSFVIGATISSLSVVILLALASGLPRASVGRDRR